MLILCCVFYHKKRQNVAVENQKILDAIYALLLADFKDRGDN